MNDRQVLCVSERERERECGGWRVGVHVENGGGILDFFLQGSPAFIATLLVFMITATLNKVKNSQESPQN